MPLMGAFQENLQNGLGHPPPPGFSVFHFISCGISAPAHHRILDGASQRESAEGKATLSLSHPSTRT